MFGGQGTHYYQMGKHLYENNDTFKHFMDTGNKIAKDLLNFSLINELYKHNKFDIFDETKLTHPALVIVQYALFKTLQHELQLEPQYCLGTSLGEIVSLAVAGYLSFEDSIFIATQQALQLTTHCQPGHMLAILDELDSTQNNPWKNLNCSIASINFPGHYVISGLPGNIRKVENILKAQEKISQLLPVSHGFHSPLIDEASPSFLSTINNITLPHPNNDIISCMTQKLVTSLSHQYFWDIIREPIYFQKTVELLKEKEPAYYIDLSPSGTLSTFLKRLLPTPSNSRTLSILAPTSDKIDFINIKNWLRG